MSGPLFTNLWRAYLKEFYELGKQAQHQGQNRRPTDNPQFRELIDRDNENRQRKIHAYRAGYDRAQALGEVEV